MPRHRTMTVGRLIAELKKWPRDMRVGFACHDNSAGEIQGLVGYVDELEDGRAKDDYGPVVMLRP